MVKVMGFLGGFFMLAAAAAAQEGEAVKVVSGMGDLGFSLTLAEGETVIPGDAGGRIALDGSSFHIDDLGADPIPARITVLGDGPASACGWARACSCRPC